MDAIHQKDAADEKQNGTALINDGGKNSFYENFSSSREGEYSCNGCHVILTNQDEDVQILGLTKNAHG